mmetsp:Transcript_6859/g.16447  ORF Transcript_6859/g.16447 Transcript_6859/m.16447 type:complete len:238 (-) Transcript_6859:1550-2263(-)
MVCSSAGEGGLSTSDSLARASKKSKKVSETALCRLLNSSTTVLCENAKTTLAQCLSIPVWPPKMFVDSSSAIQCSTQKCLVRSFALYSLNMACSKSQCRTTSISISLQYRRSRLKSFVSVLATTGRLGSMKLSNRWATLSDTSESTLGTMNLPMAIRTMISSSSNLTSALSSFASFSSLLPPSSSKLVEMNIVSMSEGLIPGVLGSAMLQCRVMRWNSMRPMLRKVSEPVLPQKLEK